MKWYKNHRIPRSRGRVQFLGGKLSIKKKKGKKFLGGTTFVMCGNITMGQAASVILVPPKFRHDVGNSSGVLRQGPGEMGYPNFRSELHQCFDLAEMESSHHHRCSVKKFVQLERRNIELSMICDFKDLCQIHISVIRQQDKNMVQPVSLEFNI